MKLPSLYIRGQRSMAFSLACGVILLVACSSLLRAQNRENRLLTSIEAHDTSEGTHVIIAETQLGTFVTRANGNRFQIIIPNAAGSITPGYVYSSRFLIVQIERKDRDALVTIDLSAGAKVLVTHDSSKIDVLITSGILAGGSDAGQTGSQLPTVSRVGENAEPSPSLAAKPISDGGVLVPQPASRGSISASQSQQGQRPRQGTLTGQIEKATDPIVSAPQEASQLHGTVTDEAGALIVGASVTLEAGHDHKYATQTNGQGQYRFDAVMLETYQVTVAAESFTPVTQQLDLTSRRSRPFDVVLKVVITEQVEIKANPTDSLSNIKFSASDIEALPDDPRKMLLKLRQIARTMGSSGDVSIRVNGFEGGSMPPKDAIQMIRINTNSFAAEYPAQTGGVIEIITKPGSDHFHGSLTFDFNDESLNARNAFALTRAPLQNRSFSGSFGGSIIPNRWGFFANFNHRAQDENALINANILNPFTLLPQSFVTTVSTPTRGSDLQVSTDLLVANKHHIGVGYNHTSDKAHNQGVGEFELPERAFLRSTIQDRLRLSLTSIYSENTLNEMRVELSRSSNQTRALSSAPAIIVLDEFSGGGNQGALFNTSSSNTLRFTDNLSVTSGKHAIKLGYNADASQLKNLDRSNFGGTFTYGTDFERDTNGAPLLDSNGQPLVITPLEHYRRTLLGLPGYRPSQFSIVRGDPFTGFTQWEMAAFVQDDWRVLPRLSLSYGLRYQLQTHLSDKINFAPRLAFAWRPSEKHEGTIRAGVGIFYQSIGTDITLNTTRFDGRHQEELTVQRPLPSPKISEIVNSADAPLPTTQIKSPDLRSPYLIISKVKYQHPLPWNLYGSISYTWQRGVHLLRLRNINAPLPGSPNIRPIPAQGPRLQFESTALSTYHDLSLGLWGNLNDKISISAGYTLASGHSDTDGSYTTPANSYDLSTEFGRAGGLQRHQFYLGAEVTLPWGIYMGPNISAASSSPFNITTGLDNNGDTFFTDRPAFAQAGSPGAIMTRFGNFNLNPQPGDRIIPRNFGNGPGAITANVNFTKTFSFRSSGSGEHNTPATVGSRRRGFGSLIHSPYNLTGNVDVHNLFNHTNFGGYNDVLTSPFFGRANYANEGRRINLSLRFSF